MSVQLVKAFQKRLEDLIHYGGTRNETSVRAAFQQLLSAWAENSGDSLRLVTERAYQPAGKKGKLYPDGTICDSLQQARGYWESKDEADTLTEEITKKLAKGYPKTNIIFEDTQTAVLMQHGEVVVQASMDNAAQLDSLLRAFFGFIPEEVTQFRRAIEVFRQELPGLLDVLRGAIGEAEQNNAFGQERDTFTALGRRAINPGFTDADAGEMLIQHILTGELFRSVFNNSQYFEENNIAQQLERVSHTFYVGKVRGDVERLTRMYYGAINAAASRIADHHEKQRFLKVLYENFYRAYNPAGAEKLGIFYTPGEIVRFMIHATDALLERHFGKGLADRGVEILDPATGTGTFITELIDYLPKNKLKYKYEHELHCNELALLPYYIANLNIEATYAQKMNEYLEFKNIVLVDTLDNTGFGIRNENVGLFGGLSAENLERVQRQNERPIKVIIGNPPYRANQANENDNNKNREYPKIDGRIKQTYIAASTAQKTKLYDMYARFLRWATDRLKDDGIVAFVMNRSFVDSRTFDGFRKVAAEEYTHIYVVDLGGDVRANPKLSGPKHNVFAIQTGIAIAFLVREKPAAKGAAAKGAAKPAVIEYVRRPELETAGEKLAWLGSAELGKLDFERIRPDSKHNWVNQADGESDWATFLPVADKGTKNAKTFSSEQAIFRLYSLGIATNRDDWIYDFSKKSGAEKAKYFILKFKTDQKRWLKSGDATAEYIANSDIKWTSELESHLTKGTGLEYSLDKITRVCYRPFFLQYAYYDKLIVHRPYQQEDIFPIAKPANNIIIAFNVSDSPFNVLASK